MRLCSLNRELFVVSIFLAWRGGAARFTAYCCARVGLPTMMLKPLDSSERSFCEDVGGLGERLVTVVLPPIPPIPLSPACWSAFLSKLKLMHCEFRLCGT